MSRTLLVCGLLTLLIGGSQAKTLHPRASDDGCNGKVTGIPCCEDEFVAGDNKGPDEIFIQAGDYDSSCAHTCKSLHPKSVGITESVNQQYDSWFGSSRNKNKCWCEFGKPHLYAFSRAQYRTCLFRKISKLEPSSSSDQIIPAEVPEPPKYIMVVSNANGKMDIDALWNGYSKKLRYYDLGRYTLQKQSHNNFPVWKKEKIHPEQYLFMSDRHHWGVGPNINTSMFGIVNDDRPTPVLPHLGMNWLFWHDHQWKEDKFIQVLGGERKDEGVNREIIMMDFKRAEIDNVNNSSLCCGVCKGRRSAHLTAMFNYDKKKKQCGCFATPWYSDLKVKSIVATRYNSEITSGLCDVVVRLELTRRVEVELARRAGLYEDNPVYTASDVQGPLGVNRTFFDENLIIHAEDVILDRTKSPLDPNSCCKECRKKNAASQIFEYYEDSNNFVFCSCYSVQPGTRPVTKLNPKKYAGICDGA